MCQRVCVWHTCLESTENLVDEKLNVVVTQTLSFDNVVKVGAHQVRHHVTTQITSNRKQVNSHETRHRLSTSTCQHFALGIMLSQQPVHRLQIRPTVHN